MLKQKPRRFFLLLFLVPSLALSAALWFFLDWNFLGAWLLSANVVALGVWSYDKISSKRNGWRVPEFSLHVMSLLGATPAAFLGMKLMRHKSLKMHFAVLYGIFFLIQIAFLITWTSSNP